VPGYEILGELARAGMGIVYKARQISLNRVVALKLMRHRELMGPEDRARFRVEAEAVARLDHPHIVRVYDFGEFQGLPFLSMEFVEGGNLAERLAGGTGLPGDEAAALVEKLARAVHAAHQRHVIHRDLKPANVLLTGGPDKPVGQCTPKVADFGLAKMLDGTGGLTETYAVMGTASYMAPEQAEGKNREVGPAADVYGLGAILYECLTGRPPFRAATREQILFQVMGDEPIRPTHWQPAVPADLEAICLKCLEKAPAQRYCGALELAEDLRRFQEGEALSFQPLEEWERQARWSRRAGYEVLDLLGCSVLGLVYKARQVRLNRLVTLKTISARAQLEPAKMERFRTEAVAHLLHPNIVQVYDYGEQQGQPYLVLEFVEGGTLADRCDGQPQPPRKAAALIETLARATHCAHRQGIIHTDLRPFNVLLTTDGIAKITGFGLARLLEKGQQDTAERGARRVLSNYLAPEQAGGRTADVGPATDVHALGAMLYELLTGVPPFLADTVADTLEQIRSKVSAPPSRLRPGLPERLDAVCLKCLHKEPGRRYQSAEELADELRRYLGRDQTGTDEFELVPGYELLNELGRGGTGVVYRALQLSLDRLVALKIFREQLGRILAANKAVARLQHTNLVQVYDGGERDGLLYVAEELVDGGSLEEQAAGRPQPPAEAARLVEVLARAMQYVHDHGVVHRNLKPRVVLLTALGVPKIGSFDLARLLDQDPDEKELEGGLLGTPQYMAPEQVAGRVRDVGPATDVYALGAILYELLTGRPPFVTTTLLELLQQVLSQPPEPPGVVQPGVPAPLETICLKCLGKEPGQRYPSAQALADDLYHYRTRGRLPPKGPSTWRRMLNWVRRRAPRPE
jgi:serine/threonine protein kinase